MISDIIIFLYIFGFFITAILYIIFSATFCDMNLDFPIRIYKKIRGKKVIVDMYYFDGDNIVDVRHVKRMKVEKLNSMDHGYGYGHVIESILKIAEKNNYIIHKIQIGKDVVYVEGGYDVFE